MNTADKLAEALTLGLECAYELLAEKRQALAGHPEKVAPYQEMADYLRRELAAHEQAQAAPLKERPDFIAGYYAGLADGRRCAERDAAERAKAGEPVVPYLYVYEYDSPFGLNREFYPSGWNGQKPTRTVPLYTTPQPALAQRREPLTDEQIRREKPVCADWVSFRAGVRCAERIHGVGK